MRWRRPLFREVAQIDVIALVTAQALMAHKRWNEAVMVLRPLLGELHAGDRPKIAEAMTAAA